MFFIQSGEVIVSDRDGKDVAILQEGQHFGEISILTRCERNATVRAATHCRCLTLDTADFHRVSVLERPRQQRIPKSTSFGNFPSLLLNHRLQVLVHFPHIAASIKTLAKDIRNLREQLSKGDAPNPNTIVPISETPCKEGGGPAGNF